MFLQSKFTISKSVIYRLGLSVVLMGGALALPVLTPTLRATAVPKHQISEVQAPKLLKVSGIHLEPYGVGTLYFTIDVPQSYGKPIEAIRIAEIPSGHELLTFSHPRSQVVLGDRVAKNSVSIPLMSVGGSDTDEFGVLLALTEPIQPGRTVTVAVTTDRNPNNGGIHQFGVTAYPTKDGNSGLYLGTGRVHFNDRN